ncbi:Glycosyltransferase involved in cell wall bisynthesis [[Clostridium] aminophilum]|uniref:Glycosyltransferase involved in cell wall bisynthesis n=1 Tax=[Clostridium] aminophilum TaxID=1526 RepID=A0A1I0B5P3_9FIRM|nr:glycosyltransferase family 4 protein [[Clostridium] aminophilum]SET02178.1 Glycosyltransferase involved in cell wall bisynthesis [[Clostridium] aminophilum]
MIKPKVIMIGPGRDVMGGVSTVINNYYAIGLDNDVDLYYLPTMEDGSKVKKLVVAAKAYMAFGRLVKKYDIVHIHMAAQASFDRKSLFVKRAKKIGKKIIIHQHAADFDKYFFEQVDDKKRTRIKEIFGLADKVIVLSEEWAEFFGKNVCDQGKIEVLYNGVVMPEYEKKDYSDHNVLMLGRLGERKGTYDLLKAIPKVLEQIGDATFYFGGDGDVEQCKKIVAENGLADHVKFLGWVRDEVKEKYLKTCNTFILPSYHEGMPMAVLEAMSYGLTTISTNAGGIPQIIEQGVSGIRVEAGDIDAISSALIDVLKDKDKRMALGKAGRERIRVKFDLRANVIALEKMYQLLCGDS